jgi:alpha-2-macroglobulin
MATGDPAHEPSRAPASGSLGPYRTQAGPEARKPWRPPAVVIAAGAMIALGIALALVPQAAREPALLVDAPAALLDGLTAFPPAEADLPPSTPLSPLLVSDAPDSLAVIHPPEGVTRITRGETLLVRFNRPMVRGPEVGRAPGAPPFAFTPAVPGTFRWVSRSSILFTPAVLAFDRRMEAEIVLGEEVTSLDGETLWDETPRVVVFDGSPRFLQHSSTVAVGEPLRMVFDAQVSASELAGEMLAWEVQGRRPVPLRIAGGRALDAADPDAPLRYEVSLLPGRTLEAGAQIAVALAPRWDRWGGSHPRVVQFAMAPRPRVTGIGCEISSYGTARCTFSREPGQIVDVGPSLRLLASERLAPLSSADVRISPPLPGHQVALEGQGAEQGRVIAISGEWEPDQV